YTDRRLDTIPLLSISMTLLLAGLLGFFDDVLGWKKGISPAKRVLLTMPLSLPLVVVKAGTSIIELPIIGLLDLGVLYPLLVVPIGVIGASNAFNMIAGYNGLEATQALIILTFSSILAYIRSQYDAVAIILPIAVSILVFYSLYNKYPARAFPGNSFTYGIGALYASLAIYWNFEKYAVMTFTLYFIELALFIRGLINKVYKENFGKVQSDGSLLPPYDKSYSVTHIAIKIVNKIKGKCYEQDVVRVIALLQSLICLVSLCLVITM
ncbi:MAG: glycosyl transferase family 4, partial [Desulfurococcaceae archaeon]